MAYSPVPVKTSTRGPKILTAVGGFLLLAAIVVTVLVVRLFLSVLPTGLVAADGAPGPDAVGGTEVPGSVTLSLPANSLYAVYLAHPTGVSVQLSDDVVVTGPDGQPAASAAAPSGTTSSNGVTARDISAFRTSAAGDYTITAPELEDPDPSRWATIIVTESDNIPGFIGGVFGTIAGVFLAIGLGLAGVIVTICGAIWWYTRRQAQRRVEAGGGQPPSAGQYPGPPGQHPGPPGQYPGPPGQHPGPPGQYPGGQHPGEQPGQPGPSPGPQYPA